ncbi:predicted protein [Sclerotinia sclerotiorum 1980 UF-70]|uniref:Uncharacterized protein n=1 Tax=Sclerotinia sclerotiorum (strain ATCC 18683 / 1980 / Ss-1) TaxID=665079 RepID=A7ESQ7_SCLS1|nr:predicted protein [Sclerotinia sclerotiorum 1980 UF-70]EDN92499.1 predicted protein [Sclerotinia sclerotiorum 1980 UF-70]
MPYCSSGTSKQSLSLSVRINYTYKAELEIFNLMAKIQLRIIPRFKNQNFENFIRTTLTLSQLLLK